MRSRRERMKPAESGREPRYASTQRTYEVRFVWLRFTRRQAPLHPTRGQGDGGEGRYVIGEARDRARRRRRIVRGAKRLPRHAAGSSRALTRSSHSEVGEELRGVLAGPHEICSFGQNSCCCTGKHMANWVVDRTVSETLPSRSGAAPKRRISIIFNPAAGRRRWRTLDWVVRAQRENSTFLSPGSADRGTRPAWHAVRCRRGRTRLLRRAATGRSEQYVAGMIGGNALLGIVPMGTASVVAAKLQLPCRPDAVAAVIERETSRALHVPRANSRPFLLMAGAGFDGAVVESVTPSLKRRLGRVPSPRASALASRKRARMWLESDTRCTILVLSLPAGMLQDCGSWTVNGRRPGRAAHDCMRYCSMRKVGWLGFMLR